jgi:hypothetical protein
MPLIRCTQKLLRELEIQGYAPLQESSSTGLLGDWYANLMRIERRKCLLFTSGKTLYSFFVPGVRKAELQNLLEMFRLNLRMNLAAELTDAKVIDRIMEQYAQLSIAGTSNRSVLGSMNDIARHVEFYISYRAGGLDTCDIISLNKELNRIPMKAIGYRYAIEKLIELVKTSGHS